MILDLGCCRVRPLDPSDAGALARHANNRRIWRNVRDRFPHPYAEADAAAFITEARELDPPCVFAIEAGGEAAGAIGFERRCDIERLSAEVGFWLGESFWGHGIATAALRAVTAVAFEHHHLVRVDAAVLAWNAASMRVLEKAGYVKEGVCRSGAVKDGQVVDTVLYACVSSAARANPG